MYSAEFYKNLTEKQMKEKIREEGFDPIKLSNAPGFVYLEHKHPETKLLAFLSGSIKVTVQNKTFICKSGDKIIVPGNTIHSAIVGENGCEFFWSEKLV